MRVVHCKREPYDVYIGRPSKWGNPFSCKEGTLAKYKVSSREESIEAYREWITQGDGKYLLNDLDELEGKVLGCWCKPNTCHGDILVELMKKNKAIEGIVIFSGSNDALGAALTNPTHYNPRGGTSSSKGKLMFRYAYLDKGLNYNGEKYRDVEEAFLTLRDISLRSQIELMIDLIFNKFIQYPFLYLEIDHRGGREFLEKCVHMYDANINPAEVERGSTNDRWTSDGDDMFMYCLITAYDKYSYLTF